MRVPIENFNEFTKEIDISEIYRKITQLEAANATLTQALNSEISQRINLEKHTLTTHEAFSGQLTALKDSYDNFDNGVISKIEKFKSNILEEVQRKNDTLIQLIQSDRNNENKDTIENNSKDKETFTIEVNKSNSQIEEKFEQIRNYINNEQKKIKNEITSGFMKVDYIEKKINDTYVSLKNDYIDIVKEIKLLKQENENNKDFRRKTTVNIQNFQKDFIKNDEIINMFSSKIDSLINGIEMKMKNYDEVVLKQVDSMEYIKEETVNQFKAMNEEFELKFKTNNEQLKVQSDNHGKELENFEKHILSEHDKFISFIQTYYQEQNVNIKKILDNSKEDIELLKEKNDSYENIIKNLTGDVNKSLQETQNFLDAKYENILAILNKSEK